MPKQDSSELVECPECFGTKIAGHEANLPIALTPQTIREAVGGSYGAARARSNVDDWLSWVEKKIQEGTNLNVTVLCPMCAGRGQIAKADHAMWMLRKAAAQ